MGTCLYLAAACVPDRSPTSGSTAHATCGEGRPARNRGNPIRRPEPRSQGPVGSRRGRPASRCRTEPTRHEAWTKPTSLGTEWRCGDPPAGTVGQATRSPQEGTREDTGARTWYSTRGRGARKGEGHPDVHCRRLTGGHERYRRHAPLPRTWLTCESVAVNVPALLVAMGL